MNHNLANKVMNRVGDQLAALKSRWADEKEYENWDSYVTLMKTLTDSVEGAEFVAISKKFVLQWRGKPDGFLRNTFIKRGYLQTIRVAE